MLNIAHDLRNYFTVIQGRCDQAAVGAKDPLWCLSEIGKCLRLCNSAVDSMFGLDLNAVTAEVATSLLALPNLNRMIIHVDLKIDLLPLPHHGSGKAWELDRAIRNLCMNASKAIAEQHPVEGGILKISTGDDQEKTWLAIGDNGCGMSAGVAAKIMHGEDEPQKEHGRGLWIVRTVAKALGAELSCESEEGRGTVFTLVWMKVAQLGAAA